MTITDDDIFDTIAQHAENNHNIELAFYGPEDDCIHNVAIECVDCHIVLHDIVPERES